MPSGKTHDRITFSLLPVVLLASYLATRQWYLSLLVGAGVLFGGLMFGPDLDIHSVQYKRWGLFRWLWLPYRWSLRHRSFWSHGFLVGTALRLFYLILLLVLVLVIPTAIAIFTWKLEHQTFTSAFFQGLGQLQTEIIAVIVGIEIGAMGHSLSDVVVSAYQRKKSSRLKPQRKNKCRSSMSRKSSKFR